MAREGKRDVILKVAEQLFAEKGYDAAGMGEIAAKSGIPKSLIYYHFKSKEDLLDTIISSFIDEYNHILRDSPINGIEKISVYTDFLKRNRDCAKIMVSESLKGGCKNNLIFQAMGPLMGIDAEQPLPEKADHMHWVAEFFTSILPSILFVCYEEGWCNYFGVSAGQAEKDYFTVYGLTHGAYHKHIGKESH